MRIDRCAVGDRGTPPKARDAYFARLASREILDFDPVAVEALLDAHQSRIADRDFSYPILRRSRDLSAFLGTQASEMQVTALKDQKRCDDTNESTTGGRDR